MKAVEWGWMRAGVGMMALLLLTAASNLASVLSLEEEADRAASLAGDKCSAAMAVLPADMGVAQRLVGELELDPAAAAVAAEDLACSAARRARSTSPIGGAGMGM